MPLINEPAHGEISTGPKELWRHSAPESTQIHDFMAKTGQKHGTSFGNYNDLWNWSISEPAKFWEEIWHYTGIKAHTPYDRVTFLNRLSEYLGLTPLSGLGAGPAALPSAAFLRGKQAELCRESSLSSKLPGRERCRGHCGHRV